MTSRTRCRPARWAGWTLVILVMVAASAQAAAPRSKPPAERTGPIPPSIHVPPVRTSPPAKTRTIARPLQYDPDVTARKQRLEYRLESLRLAIEDLIATFGDRYPQGAKFLERWEQLSGTLAADAAGAESRFAALRDEALLANPLLDADAMLVLKRKLGQLGLPTNHQCNFALEPIGYDNELAIVSPVRPGGALRTLYRPQDGRYVGELDLHFDAERLLFTMPVNGRWQIHEIGLDGKGLRQVTRPLADVDSFDPCYLPDGRIVYASTASFTGVPCWHGRERACCLYLMDPDGGNVRQLCFDQDLDLHPAVLASGQVIYSRWDYTGLLHAYVRPLMVMNPDGTGQRAVYGSNCYYPNCLFFPQQVPGEPNKIVAILAGYHGLNRMGELAVLDVSQGWSGSGGIVHRMTHRGEPIVEVAIDPLTAKARPQFLHPYPLSDKYVLAAMQAAPNDPWGIYLVDVFDNITPVLVDPEYDFFEPILVRPRARPPVIPDRIDPARADAVVVLHDVYQGPGLKGVPRGAVKRLRIAAYHFGYPGMAGPDKIGRAGPWEATRILGTVPVHEDGSAKFRVPANTPITIQPLDDQGRAVQLMRSWYAAMPGEVATCVGCHEQPRQTPAIRNDLATLRPVSEIEPWHGPARGFDFAREVQPVLDLHCVGCHNGQPRDDGRTIPDLRDQSEFNSYAGLPLSRLGATRLDPSLASQYPERFQPCRGMPQPYGELRTLYTPAYEALIPYIRRVNIEDGVTLLRPGEYHANTSELIQLLEKGHYGVALDREAWERLATWIDLNGPCHGTWGEVAEIPGRVDRRRHELAQQFGGAPSDPESLPVALLRPTAAPIVPESSAMSPAERRETVAQLLAQLPPPAPSLTPATRTIPLGDGVELELVQIPAGSFVMGDTTGEGADDEWPARVVRIERPIWIGRHEITNAQFRRFFPDHASGYFTKRQIEFDGPGVQLDEPRQPVLRVSWDEAMAFCTRLSDLTGEPFSLPTEAQWEYAARAGTTTALGYGDTGTNFAPWANVADRSLACLYAGTAGVVNLQPLPADMRFDDQAIATATVGSYRPNAWGLYDVHGNVAEWTRSAYGPSPSLADKGGNAATPDDRKVVRGGAFTDRPSRCRSSFRVSYPAWQAVHNVGFRVVVADNGNEPDGHCLLTETPVCPP